MLAKDVRVKTDEGPKFHKQRCCGSRYELARTTYRIVSWGEDAEGEIYLVDFTGGGIHQLVKAPEVIKAQTKFPRKLSETASSPRPGTTRSRRAFIPYSVNAQLWGDHASKERFIAIPGMGQIGFDEIEYPQPSPGAPYGWRFPDGTVLVKTFSMGHGARQPKEPQTPGDAHPALPAVPRHAGVRRPVLARLHVCLERRADRTPSCSTRRGREAVFCSTPCRDLDVEHASSPFLVEQLGVGLLVVPDIRVAAPVLVAVLLRAGNCWKCRMRVSSVCGSLGCRAPCPC